MCCSAGRQAPSTSNCWPDNFIMMVQPTVPHQMNRKRMTDTTTQPNLTLSSRAQPAGLVEIAVRLCLNQRKELCPHVLVPILKPQRPCIRPPAPHRLPSDMLCQQCVDPVMSFLLDDIGLFDDDDDDDEYYNAVVPIKYKRVAFADSKGLSLTDVRVFSEDQDSEHSSHHRLDPLPSLQLLGDTITPVLSEEDCYSCTGSSTCCPGTRFQLGFPQPSADLQALCRKLAQSEVGLESCAVLAESAVLWGTVCVKNISFHKDVHVRVTFDSWRSYRDVPCVYVETRYVGLQTDIFEFKVPIPKVLDAKKKIEFCLNYLPDGYSQPFWDNNDGQNYGVHICVSKTAKQ